MYCKPCKILKYGRFVGFMFHAFLPPLQESYVHLLEFGEQSEISSFLNDKMKVFVQTFCFDV